LDDYIYLFTKKSDLKDDLLYRYWNSSSIPFFGNASTYLYELFQKYGITEEKLLNSYKIKDASSNFQIFKVQF